MHISLNLVEWYNKNKRDLPWRETQNPYYIWLSEIILQQTRVTQGMEYYLRFVKKYPTIEMLALANEDDILNLWQGLGYYTRARNLHAAAKSIYYINNSVFPQTYDEIIKLKGVGDYVAAAIASFAFKLPYPAVDGNVYRVLARLYGITTEINTGKGKKEFTQLAASILDKKNPDIHNQAIMEFGALQCVPKNPDCSVCPFNDICYAFLYNIVDKLPVKPVKKKQTNRYFNYLYIKYLDYIFITKRVEKDIWRNLYELPLIETESKLSPEIIFQNDEWKRIFPNFAGENSPIKISYPANDIIHILSHQRIHAQFYEIDLYYNNTSLFEKLQKLFKAIKINEIDNFAFPQLIRKYLDERLTEIQKNIYTNN